VHLASVRGAAGFVASYEPVGQASVTTAGSLEHWLTERYRLFALRGSRLVTATVAHAPWALQRVCASIGLNTLAPPGLAFEGDPVLHFSRGVDALISAPAPAAPARTSLALERGIAVKPRKLVPS
jgi:uncharacterized protein YqjF (DUF2071 family)